MAMMPNRRTLAEMMRMYSVEPVPIARSLRESIRLSDHIQAMTSSAEKNQYDTTLSRESSRIDTWALPSPNHAICVPKATMMSAARSLSHRRRAYCERQSAWCFGVVPSADVVRAMSSAPGTRAPRVELVPAAGFLAERTRLVTTTPLPRAKTTRG